MSVATGTGARARLLLRNASQIVKVGGGSKPKTGKAAMNSVEVLTNHSMLVDASGAISSIVPSGAATEALEHSLGGNVAQVVDCAGKCVLPGFVDGHTHAIFAGDRSYEHAMKLAGASYEEVHAAGGGINKTVTATRAAPAETLLEILLSRFDNMMRCGTTTCEVKSGYGLDWETEMKMLRVLQAAKSRHCMDTIGSFLVHAVPKGSTSEAVTAEVLQNLPKLAAMVETSEVCAEFVDVFCEKGFFSREDTRSILLAGKALGFGASFHGDELNDLQCGELAAEVGARAVSHLEMLSSSGVQAMAANNVHAVLLPTTAYLLRLPTPPARALVDAGVAVCLASDFNPNAHCFDMPTTMNHACVGFGMTMEEALVASTINGASALGLADRVGSLEVGKQGDCFLLDAPTWEHVIYQFNPPISEVFKQGLSTTKRKRLVGSGTRLLEEEPASMEAFTTKNNRKRANPSKSAAAASKGAGFGGDNNLQVLSRGIPFDPLPPAPAGLDPSVPHPPVRPAVAALLQDKASTALALKNALRYFPERTHAVLAPEFAQELREHGHIYMHRFRPSEYAMKAHPIEQYPAQTSQAAAIMHMIMNNLDPAVAQFPHELITYGGNGSAFSNWAQYHLTMKYLSEMTNTQTLCLHSGHPMGLFPSNADAPRLIITNGMVVPNYSTREMYEHMYAIGVSQYGQMTAGSFCYIGPQGIVHGTTLTLLNAGRKFLGLGSSEGGGDGDGGEGGGGEGGTSLNGKLFVTAGLGGMSGAQPKAAVICGAVAIVAEVDGAAVEKRFEQGWVLEKTDDLDECLNLAKNAMKEKRGTSIAFHGNVVDLWERLAADAAKEEEGEGAEEILVPHLGSDQTSCHNPFGGGYYPVDVGFEEAKVMMTEEPERYKGLVQASLRRHADAINTLTGTGSGSSSGGSAGQLGASVKPMQFFDYGNSFLLEASRAGAQVMSADGESGGGGGGDAVKKFRYPSYVEAIMGDIFSLGFGPFRWVCTSASGADLRATDTIALQVMAELKARYERESAAASSDDVEDVVAAYAAKAVPQLEDNMHWIRKADQHKMVVGSQARILYANAEARVKIALALNEAIGNGTLTAPVVLSRDHHDVSGTDSPWRETSNIEDGSKFCADMAVHNAIGDACRGATSVALHNGGGTEWGESVNGGFQLVLDGTSDAARRASQMLHWDVMNGVARRAWAGNKNALSCTEAEQHINGSLELQYPHQVEPKVLEHAVETFFRGEGLEK